MGLFAASMQYSLETDTCIAIEKHDPWGSDCQLYFIYRRKLVAETLSWWWTTSFCCSLPPGSCCRGQQSNNTHHRWHACHNGESRWHRICRRSLWQRLTRKYFWMCFVSLCWLWSISWNFLDMWLLWGSRHSFSKMWNFHNGNIPTHSLHGEIFHR